MARWDKDWHRRLREIIADLPFLFDAGTVTT